jgi:5-methylcytosine-specific restriction endonuclease McrA
MRFVRLPHRTGRAVREPRPDLTWSTRRIHRRLAYGDYMASPEWFALREIWAMDWAARYDAEPCCLICGAAWTLRHGDVHHRSYIRLGHEGRHDLIPLCRTCHDTLHRVLESDRSWRRLDRAQATDLIVATLRRKALALGVPCEIKGKRL